MSYERLQVVDHVDKWDAAKLRHVEDGIIANEEAIKNFQVNWSQSDSSASDYIQNRPFYEDFNILKTIIEKEEINCKDNTVPFIKIDNTIEYGQIYKIIFDSIKYICQVPKDYEHGRYLGNGNLVFPDVEATDEPFCLTFTQTGPWGGIFYIYAETGIHTIQVFELEKKLVQLDEKFISNTTTNKDWNQNDSQARDYIQNRPFYEDDAEEVLILEETEIETEAKYGSTTPYMDIPLMLKETKEGDIFKVILDDQLYYAIAKDLVEGRNDLFLGNLSLVSNFLKNNEHYPFAIRLGTNQSYGSGTIYTLKPGIHTVSIYKINRVVKKINKQFIGETGALQSNGKIRKPRFFGKSMLEQIINVNYEVDTPYTALLICEGDINYRSEEYLNTDCVIFYENKKYNVKPEEKFFIRDNIEVCVKYYRDLSSAYWILVTDPKYFEQIKNNYIEISVITEEYDRIPSCCVDFPCGIPTNGEIQIRGNFPAQENINGIYQMLMWSGNDLPSLSIDNYTEGYGILTGNITFNSYFKNLYFIEKKPFTFNDIKVWIEYQSGQYGAPGKIFLKSYNSLQDFVGQDFYLRAAAGKIRKLDPMFLPDSVIASSDWNAEAGQDGYIANRTHYTTYHYNIEIDTDYFGEMEVGPGYYYYKLPYSDLQVGKLVTDDGKYFLFTVDIPFYINNQMYTVRRQSNGDLLLITSSSAPLNCRMTLYKGTETGIKQLDAKYLPKATAVSDAIDTVTPEQFNALLNALRDAGYLATE